MNNTLEFLHWLIEEHIIFSFIFGMIFLFIMESIFLNFYRAVMFCFLTKFVSDKDGEQEKYRNMIVNSTKGVFSSGKKEKEDE